jgi:hypothetical protein
VPITTQCPSCNHKLRAPDNLRGKMVRCPACQEKFRVEEGGEEEPAETAVRTTPAKSKPAPTSYEEDARPRRRRRNEEVADDEEDEVEDEDEYDDRPRRRKRRQARRGAAASAVAGPAIALMIVGGLALLLSALSLVGNLVGAALVAPQAAGGQGGANVIANAASGIGGAVFGLCWGGIVVSGAVNMLRLRAYGHAMTASIVAMLPCNLCCLLGLPFGIWALVAMNRPDVKDAFR